MRIGLDARLYGLKNAGIGRYLQKLIENLEKVDTENQYVVFLRKENWDEYQPQNPNFKKVLADYRPYSRQEQILMPWKIWRQKVDLMHFPHFNVPIFYAGRRQGRRQSHRLGGASGASKFVVTIHDLIPLHFSGRETSALNPILHLIKKSVMKMVMSRAVKKAKKIIAVSEYTKKDILEHFKVASEKIKVIYEGAPTVKLWSQKVMPPPLAGSRQLAGESWSAQSLNHSTTPSLSKYGISKPYLLYVGSAFPHKNLERLLKAFEGLAVEYFLDYQLVLVGKEDYFYKKLKEKVIANRFLAERVVFTGYVADEELGTLYQNAILYVFPSLLEGFGLPPLEAMNHSLPVVSSDASCLPEILGDAAEYFNPHNIDDMIRTVKAVLDDENRRQELIKKGDERIKQFNWQKCAKGTMEVYQASF